MRYAANCHGLFPMVVLSLMATVSRAARDKLGCGSGEQEYVGDLHLETVDRVQTWLLDLFFSDSDLKEVG